jgi:hypothetical protein
MKAQTVKKPAASAFVLALSRAGAAVMVLATVSGCVNSRLGSLADQISKSSTTSGTSSTVQGGDSYKIGNVTIAAASSSSGTAAQIPTVTIYFDPSRAVPAVSGSGAPMISTHCGTGGTSGSNPKACVCQFNWTESNGTTGNNLSFQRSVQTPVTNVQQQLVSCSAPDVYSTEITDGTSIKITVVASAGSAETFNVAPYSYTKSSTQVVGSFRDAQGHAFDNVLHYSCYEQFKIGTVIQSKIGTASRNQPQETNYYPKANQFCVQKPNATTGSPECPNLPSQLSNSSQAYYYNFFVRASEAGDVNQWNDRYTCPSVKEPVYNGGTVGSQASLYPMDTNFALSLGKSPSFNVGVDAFVELSNGGGDPISAGATACDGSKPPNNGSTNGFVKACLGFASKPNPDGTCPYFRDSSGAIRFTYRLRRLIALYPPLFGVDGKAPTTPQATDTIYVLDRPVTPPSGSDPLKPYTMRGPKPCPFALFDSKGVLGYSDPLYSLSNNGYLPVYGSTNNAAWNGTNVDGIEFPNFDSGSFSSMSCSAAIPLVQTDPLNPDLTMISLGTVNKNNPLLKRLFVRPIHSWAPHYEEDLDFQACAPQSSPVHDPPLHFAKDFTTGNVSWCAEVYPSQNDHVAALDRVHDPSQPLSSSNPYVGHVRPYTSHIAKNSASGDCHATIPTTIPTGSLYPAATGASCPLPGSSSSPSALARHPADALVDTKNVYPGVGVQPPLTPAQVTNVCANNTCDRTAIITGGLAWQQFPLLASAPQVEQAIGSDTTYGCVLTYDGGGTKTGKTTPKQGCCGPNVQLYSGPRPAAGASADPTLLNTNAHLEPDAPCLMPQY